MAHRSMSSLEVGEAWCLLWWFQQVALWVSVESVPVLRPDVREVAASVRPAIRSHILPTAGSSTAKRGACCCPP